MPTCKTNFTIKIQIYYTYFISWPTKSHHT
uniref:Uncharacterized protein n=1 Tax=Rhizophora mucronata TaxID=61149 RepID=A0A2P2MW82_RHIMU